MSYDLFRTTLSFTPVERPDGNAQEMNLAFLLNRGPEASVAGVTTKNRFPGAPVILTRRRLDIGGFRAILVNNRIANVAVPSGLDDARTVAAAAASAFSLAPETVLPSSTGIIGWRLPVAEMVASVESLPASPCSPREFAEAIMTTDRYPKIAVREIGDATVLGIAKGAGMIQPNMATMLAYIVTDARVEQQQLRQILSRVVTRTFNRISVDGDESTSDSVLAIANGASGASPAEDVLENAIAEVCSELALEIVRNGEGTAHVIETTVRGVSDESLADRIARAVVNSPLVKTAINGNDPNIGRVLAAVGAELARAEDRRRPRESDLTIAIDSIPVFSDGGFRLSEAIERTLTARLVELEFDATVSGYPQIREPVRIEIDFAGDTVATPITVIGSDLSHQYIVENAEYRS